MASNKRTAMAATAFLVINHTLTKKRKRSKRCWIKKLYQNRFEYGNKLLQEMTFDNTVENFTFMSLVEFDHLCSLIDKKIRRSDTNFREAIKVKERLLITLKYLATGDSYSSLQYLFRVSKQSISTIVPEVCAAIIEVLKDYVKLPSDDEEWLKVAEKFENKWDFPHAIGAMDGKHIMLQSPMANSNDYDNLKLFPSLVLFALVDADYKFLYVDVGSKEQIIDSSLFKNTSLYKKMEKKELNLPAARILQTPYTTEVPYFILGDKIVTLNEYTMKPFFNTPDQGTMERIFNYRLSRARRVVENAFGVLSSAYRVLKKPILLEPERATKIVLATVHLYNYLQRSSASKFFTPPGTFDKEENGNFIPGHWRNDQKSTSLIPIRAIPRRGSNQAKELRSHLAKHFSTNGAIPWQNEEPVKR